jgi:hypothetical protein
MAVNCFPTEPDGRRSPGFTSVKLDVGRPPAGGARPAAARLPAGGLPDLVTLHVRLQEIIDGVGAQESGDRQEAQSGGQSFLHGRLGTMKPAMDTKGAS